MQKNDRNPETVDERGGTDNRANLALPVTAEVGGEGGSFADSTTQVATFGGPLDSLERAGAASTAGDAIRSEDVIEGGVGAGPGPADGMTRYPSEDPESAAGIPTTERRRPDWRGTLIGAAAGLAGAAIAGSLSRRGRRRG
ncbi:MAG: hypothetical protein V7647_1244 [Acidobacteriota bacterium]|jgi:hypothetical protein